LRKAKRNNDKPQQNKKNQKNFKKFKKDVDKESPVWYYNKAADTKPVGGRTSLGV
jgi:hypothetical protein